MASSLSSLPLWLLTILVLGASVLIGFGFSVGIRKLFRLNPSVQEADLAIDLMQVASTYIGILLAFAGVLAWQDYKGAEIAIEQEAAAASQLYRDLTIYGPEFDEQRQDLRAYLNSIIVDEWPMVRDGKRSDRTESLLIKLFERVGSADPTTARQNAIYAEALSQLNKLVELRRNRIATSSTTIPPVLWVVAIVGSILTIAYAASFVSTRYATLMICGISLTIGLMFLFLMSVNNPFRGPRGLGPGPLMQLPAILDKVDRFHGGPQAERNR